MIDVREVILNTSVTYCFRAQTSLLGFELQEPSGRVCNQSTHWRSTLCFCGGFSMKFLLFLPRSRGHRFFRVFLDIL
ncbi:unnamed protein product, partial [Amoebophrya sp. A25]|eukprot:GSA25T00000460001.1